MAEICHAHDKQIPYKLGSAQELIRRMSGRSNFTSLFSIISRGRLNENIQNE